MSDVDRTRPRSDVDLSGLARVVGRTEIALAAVAMIVGVAGILVLRSVAGPAPHGAAVRAGAGAVVLALDALILAGLGAFNLYMSRRILVRGPTPFRNATVVFAMLPATVLALPIVLGVPGLVSALLAVGPPSPMPAEVGCSDRDHGALHALEHEAAQAALRDLPPREQLVVALEDNRLHEPPRHFMADIALQRRGDVIAPATELAHCRGLPDVDRFELAFVVIAVATYFPETCSAFAGEALRSIVEETRDERWRAQIARRASESPCKEIRSALEIPPPEPRCAHPMDHDMAEAEARSAGVLVGIYFAAGATGPMPVFQRDCSIVWK